MKFTSLLVACLIAGLTGCGDAKQAASLAITEITKSDTQRQAERLCLQAAVNEEARRTPGLKSVLDMPAETRSLGQNHYLVTISYKKVTLEDPGTTSNNLDMYSGATCDVHDGKIVEGRLKKRLFE
jgi:hypothetical protein